MKHTLLKEAQQKPDEQFLINFDSALGESLVCSLNDLRALPYIKNDDDLLQFEIYEYLLDFEIDGPIEDDK